MTSTFQCTLIACVKDNDTSTLTSSDHQELFERALGESATCDWHEEVDGCALFCVSCKCDSLFDREPTAVALLQICLEHGFEVADLQFEGNSMWTYASYPIANAIPLMLKAGFYPTGQEFVDHVVKGDKNNWNAFASSITDVRVLITPEVYSEFGTAFRFEHYKTASRMIEIGLPVRMPEIAANLEGYTQSLMHLCLQSNAVSTLEELLRAGGDPNEVHKGQVPLFHLVQSRYPYAGIERLKLMLENGADPNGMSDVDVLRRTSLLEVAISAGWRDAASVLIEAGADPHQLNDNGQTLWFAAVMNYNQGTIDCNNIVFLLKRLGVDINVVDSDGLVALSYCTDASLFQFLVSNGALVRHVESTRTSYTGTCLMNQRFDILKMLFQMDVPLSFDIALELQDLFYTPGLFKAFSGSHEWSCDAERERTLFELKSEFDKWALRQSMGTFLMGVRKTDQGSKQSPLERFVDDPHFDANVLGMMADFIVPRKHRKPVTRRHTHWDPAPDASSAAPDASSSSSAAVKKQRLD